MHIKNFYLNTPMLRPEYLKIKTKFILQDVQDKYNIHHKIIHGHFYVENFKGSVWFTTSRHTSQLSAKRLENYGFAQTKHMYGLCTHAS